MHLPFTLWIVLSVMFFTGCNTKRQGVVQHIDSVINKQSDSGNWDAEFQGYFIYHFMTDSIFQKERTDPSIHDMGFINYFAGKDYTMHVYFSSESNYDEHFIDEIDHQNQLTVIQDQHIKTYAFSKKQDKWFLTDLTESSFNLDSVNMFVKFMYQFSKDTSFRNAHIRFPLKFTYADAEWDYEDTTVFISKKDLSFNYDFFADKYFYFFHNKLDQIDRSKYMFLLLRGIDNGIFMVYYFEKEGDSWILIEENDSST